MKRFLRRCFAALLVIAAAALAIAGARELLARSCISIGPDEFGVVIASTGDDPPPGQVLAGPGQRGARRDVLTAGTHWISPFTERVEKHQLIQISGGTDAREENGRTVPATAPEVGIVTARVGGAPEQGEPVSAPGRRGIQAKVLTPGLYALNPYAYRVERRPATIIPAGYVGVMTHLAGKPAPAQFAAPDQRGVLPEPLPPGLYYINPYEMNVQAIRVGYQELSFVGDKAIAFPAADGNPLRVEASIVWGITPADAPYIVKQFGSEEAVVSNAIWPQVESKARVIGSSYTSRDFVDGESRERFQDELAKRLQEALQSQHVRVLMALVRDTEVPEIVRKPIQSSKVAAEEALTNAVKSETAKLLKDLSELKAAVEIEATKVRTETARLVDEETARATGESEKIRAQSKATTAELLGRAAGMRAQAKSILSAAESDAAAQISEAEAAGLERQIASFGGAKAYALWRFATGLPDALAIELRRDAPAKKGDGAQ